MLVKLNVRTVRPIKVDPEIEELWKRIDYQIKTHSNAKTVLNVQENGLKVTSRFKVIRVFVSSTFTDFFNEREVLVKQVNDENFK